MNKSSLLTCSFLDIHLETSKEILTANIIICILNAIFSLITFMANAVILHAIKKTQELHSPSFILLFCLAAADLLTGLICQPFFVAYKIAELENDFNAYCPLRMIQTLCGWTTAGVSLVTLSGISVDRLVALTLHLRYRTIVTVPRVIQIAICTWIGCTIVVLLRLWLKNWLFLPLVILLLSFFVTVLSALKIFQLVKRHRRQINQQQQSIENNNMVNVFKCRKSAVTVFYIYGLFLLFYLPFCVTIIVDSFTGYTKVVKITYDFAATAVYINSFLNPFVYCWRIREIRQAVKNTLRQYLIRA